MKFVNFIICQITIIEFTNYKLIKFEKICYNIKDLLTCLYILMVYKYTLNSNHLFRIFKQALKHLLTEIIL